MQFLKDARLSPYWLVGGEFVLYSGDVSDYSDNSFGIFGGIGVLFKVTPEFSLLAKSTLDVDIAPDFEMQTHTSEVGLIFHF